MAQLDLASTETGCFYTGTRLKSCLTGHHDQVPLFLPQSPSHGCFSHCTKSNCFIVLRYSHPVFFWPSPPVPLSSAIPSLRTSLPCIVTAGTRVIRAAGHFCPCVDHFRPMLPLKQGLLPPPLAYLENKESLPNPCSGLILFVCGKI